MKMQELIEKWCDENKARSFEGDRGLQNLEKLFTTLGYKADGFQFGSVIEKFLSDNPGCQEAIIDWIVESNVPEWREILEDEVGSEDDET